MRVVGLLSWFDEPVEWLVDCVQWAAMLCDHVIAVDGPYMLWPDERNGSDIRQSVAIAEAAAEAGIGCTVHTPYTRWGSEAQKRDYMFRLASTMTEPTDWLLRIDGDEYLDHVPSDIHERLEAASEDVAEVLMRDTRPELGHVAEFPLRALFRALPGIGVQQAHYLVTVPSSRGVRVLCGSSVHIIEPALQLHDLTIMHRQNDRSETRKAQKAGYYRVREPFERPTSMEELR